MSGGGAFPGAALGVESAAVAGAVPGGRVAERQMQVRWSDGDPLGHVNNAVYLTYLESARGGLVEDALGAGEWSNWILARIELDFLREIPISVREITVRCAVLRIGNSSVRTRDEAVLADGTVAARAEAVIVVRNLETGRPRPLSERERVGLARYLVVEEEPSPSV